MPIVVATPVSFATRNLSRLQDVVRERLLAIDMLFEAHRADAHVGVQMIGRGAENRIDGLLLLQQVTKILVSRDFVVWRLRGEVLLDLGLHRQASSGSLVIERVEILRLDGIGHGDDLRVGFLEKCAHIGAPLTAAADDGDVHLPLGGTKAAPPRTWRGTMVNPVMAVVAPRIKVLRLNPLLVLFRG